MTDDSGRNDGETRPITLKIETRPHLSNGAEGDHRYARLVDHEFRLRFAELAERDQSMALTVARIESTAATSQLQLHEQLQTIMSSLTQLTEISMDMQSLHSEMREKRQEHEHFRSQELKMQKSLEVLSQHIVKLEEENKSLRNRQFWFDVHSITLLIIALVVLYHVFFGH